MHHAEFLSLVSIHSNVVSNPGPFCFLEGPAKMPAKLPLQGIHLSPPSLRLLHITRASLPGAGLIPEVQMRIRRMSRVADRDTSHD